MAGLRDTLAALDRVGGLRARLQAGAGRYGLGAARLLRGPVDDELQLLEYLLGEERDRYAAGQAAAGSAAGPYLSEAERWQVGEARDMLACWDHDHDHTIYGTDRSLADHVRALLAIADRLPAPGGTDA